MPKYPDGVIEFKSPLLIVIHSAVLRNRSSLWLAEYCFPSNCTSGPFFLPLFFRGKARKSMVRTRNGFGTRSGPELPFIIIYLGDVERIAQCISADRSDGFAGRTQCDLSRLSPTCPGFKDGGILHTFFFVL